MHLSMVFPTWLLQGSLPISDAVICCCFIATHFIVFGEEIGVCDVGTEENVAHQVDEAQTQALESRDGAERNR